MAIKADIDKTPAIVANVRTALTATTANPWEGKAYGTDVYRGADKITLPPGSLDFGVAKMGGSNGGLYLDEKHAQHIQAFWDCGAVPMSYWYVDARWYLNRGFTLDGVKTQINTAHPIYQTIEKGLRAGEGSTTFKAIRVLWLDVEEVSGGDIWVMTYIEDLRERLVALIRANGLNLKLGIYSSLSVMQQLPAVENWVAQHPEILVWTANYVYAFPGTFKPMAEHKVSSLPMLTQKPRWYGDNPAKPKQYKRFWQFHGTFDGCKYATCPEIVSSIGKPSGLDLDIFEGTRAELFAMVNMKDPLIETPPPPTPDPDPEPPPAADLTEILARLAAVESIQNANTAAITLHQERLDRHVAP